MRPAASLAWAAAEALGAVVPEAGRGSSGSGDVRGLAASSGPAVSPTWVAANEAGTEPHVGSHELRGDGELQSAVGDQRAVRPDGVGMEFFKYFNG